MNDRERVLAAPAATTADLLRLALCLGTAVGVVQAVLRYPAQKFTGQVLVTDAHVLWMAPLAYVLLFAAAALLVGLVFRGRIARWRLPAWIGVVTLLTVIDAWLFLPKVHWAAATIFGLGLSTQAARMAVGRAGSITARARRFVLPAAAALVVLAAGVHAQQWGRESLATATLPPAAPESPNILLLILDTVGARFLSVYGNEVRTTPVLEKLARRGTLYERAYAPSPWTLPSHASMFTGRPPHELSADWLMPLDARHPTIGEVLEEHGYRTGGFVANLTYATPASGLDRGYSHYDAFPVSWRMVARSSALVRRAVNEVRGRLGDRHPLIFKRAEDVNGELLDWLEGGEDSGRPWFAFVNYFDAHNPYLPPPPFDTLFGPAKNQPDLDLEDRHWDPAAIQMEIDAYLGAIAYIDDRIGALIEELERRGALNNTVLIVTADHGEQFGEHGLLYHGNGLYVQNLEVPLLIVDFRVEAAPRRDTTTVTLQDMAPTIAALAGVQSPPFQGPDLLRPRPRVFHASVRKMINRALWLPAMKGDMYAAFGQRMHYIRNGDGTEELYDLAHDPDERHNLAARPNYEERLAMLRATLPAAVTRRN